MGIFVPNLKTIDGDLNVAENRSVSERDFPSLERIGGNFVAYRSGFRSLPANLNEIAGDVIVSDLDEACLIDSVKQAKRNGVIKGNVFCLILDYDR